MLRIGPVHMVGFLGRPFVRSLAVFSAAFVICFGHVLVNLLTRFTVMICVLAFTLPAVLTPLVVHEALELVMVTSL